MEISSERLRHWASVQRRKWEFPRLSGRVLTQGQREFWARNGYLVFPGYVPEARLRELNDFVDRLWAGSEPAAEKLVADVFIGTPEERRLKLSEAPTGARAVPYKLNDIYLESAFVRELVLEENLALILTELLGAAPMVCNTLSLEYGSQQPFHTDSLYMTPPRGLNLAASWIALEDCRAEAGPLRYYPGSHKIPPHRFSDGALTAKKSEMPRYQAYMEREVLERGLKEERFPARRGDLFLWHSQLFHGGSPIENSALTRRSLVTHYYRACDHEGPHGIVSKGRYFWARAHQPTRQMIK